MSIDKFTISRDPAVYEAWPDLILTAHGRLICVFAECKSHGDRSYTRLVMTKSDDRGRTWSEKEAFGAATTGRPYWNNPRISRLSDDRLIIVADKIYEEHERGGKVFMWTSDTDGDVWEGPIATPITGIVPDKLLELSSGRWLIAAHDRNEAGFLEEKLWYSDDQACTWTGPIIVASEPGLDLCEASILPLPDGTLVSFMRENSGVGRDCYKTFSYDDGATWTNLTRVPLPGCHRPVAGYLNSGKIMITYRFMQGGKGWLGTWTQNFFAALTDTASAAATERSEQWTRILPLDFDPHPQSDLGYSGWVQFDDSEIYIVNYIMDDSPNSQIRGYSLTEAAFGG